MVAAKPKTNVTLPKKTEPKPKKVVFSKCPFMARSDTPARLKLFLWGVTGVRKTRTALAFPKPAVIALEPGTDWFRKEFDFAEFPAGSADEVEGAVDWLANNKHPYLTLIIDPISIFWDMLQKKWSDIFMVRKRGSKGFKFDFFEMSPLDWKPIKAEFKEFIGKLTALDMHIVVIAREKDQYGDGEMMRKVGVTFDGEKNSPYAFDEVIRLYKGDNDKTMGFVTKDRAGKLPKGEFECTYELIAKAFGIEYLERPKAPKATKPAATKPTASKKGTKPTKPPTTTTPKDTPIPNPPADPPPGLATAQQQKDIKGFCDALGIPDAQLTKRLKAYDAVSLATLSMANADIIIGKLEAAVAAKTV
ncbi:MAG: AAA family ATPase [candidate division Zixibacteria bacterium]|nr:AAA family ATPase [candidate division Zixibacteria bacterium]